MALFWEIKEQTRCPCACTAFKKTEALSMLVHVQGGWVPEPRYTNGVVTPLIGLDNPRLPIFTAIHMGYNL